MQHHTHTHTHTHTQWWWWCLFPHLWGFFGNVGPFIPYLCFLFCFVFKVVISLPTWIQLFIPGSVHSGSVSWDNCGWMFLDKLHVSLFLDRFAHYAWTAAELANSDFVRSRISACLNTTYHLHFWQNDQGLLCATAVTHWWNGHWIRVSTQS